MFVINFSRYTKKHTELVTDWASKSRTRPTHGIVHYWISYLETFRWLVEPWTDSKREIEKPPVWKETLLFLFSRSFMSGPMTRWTAACHASLSFSISWSLLKLMSIVSVVPSAISSSAVPFSSCLQSFPRSESFSVSQFFASGGQRIGVSASASVLPMNITGWFPLGLTGLISLQSQGLSRVFSNTTVQKHQFFGAQLSLWSKSNIHTLVLEKP